MRALRLFRWYSALTFSFAWVPVMYTAFTVDRGFSPSQYGDLWAVYYLAMVLAEVPWGRAADRWGSRPLLVGGPFLLALGFVVLGHTTSFAACVVGMAVTGAAHAMISGADSAYLYETVAAADRRRDALHEEAVAHRWRLFGVSAADVSGGLVAFAFGTAAAFDLSVGLMLAAGGVALAMPSVRPPTIERPTLASALAGLARPGVVTVIAWYLAVFVLLRLGFQLYQPTLIAAGAPDLRLHGGVLALLNLVAGAASFAVARLHRRFGERRTAAGVLAALALSFAGLAGLPGVALIAALFCAQQVSFGFLQPIGRTALNHRIPSTNRAGILSVQSMVARLGFAAVMFFGNWDEAFAGELPTTYTVLAVVGAAAAVVFAFARHLNRPDPSETIGRA